MNAVEFWKYLSETDKRVEQWSEPQRSNFQQTVATWPNKLIKDNLPEVKYGGLFKE